MSIILPERKEYLAGLLGLGGGSTGMAFGGALPTSDFNYIDDYYHTSSRKKLSNPNTNNAYDRVQAGIGYSSVGGGDNALQIGHTGYNRTNADNGVPIRDTALSGASAGKQFTISAWVFVPVTQVYMTLFNLTPSSGQGEFDFGFGHYFACNAWNTSGTRFLDVNTSSYQPVPRNKWVNIIVSMDLSDTSKRSVWIDDTQTTNWTWGTYSNQDINWGFSRIRVGMNGSGGSKFNGYMAHFYFEPNYININTESNRRIFRTAEGNPTSQASLAARNPLIYLPLQEDLTNKGTGGDFEKSTTAAYFNYTNVDGTNGGPGGPARSADDWSSKGGLVWTKGRTNTQWHILSDTARPDGGDYQLHTNNQNAQANNVGGQVNFDHQGFSIQPGFAENNATGNDYIDWCWGRKPGFFDIIYYTGDGQSGRQIAHNLDCIPGMMVIKGVSSSGTDWQVYNGSHNINTGRYKNGELNGTAAFSDNTAIWNDTAPTKTHFTVGNSTQVNEVNQKYVAYMWAHAPSPVEARLGGHHGVEMDPSDHPFSGSGNATNGMWSVREAGPSGAASGQTNIKFYDMGTDDFTFPGEFTIEFWYKQNSTNYNYLFTLGDSGTWDGGKGIEAYFSGSTLKIYRNGSDLGGSWTQNDSNWHHFAMERNSSNTLKVYIDGTERYSFNNITGDVGGGASLHSGMGLPLAMGDEVYNGQDYGNLYWLSNLRVTKGQQVYGSAFTPPTAPLTTTSQGVTASNVKLLALRSPYWSDVIKGPKAKGSSNTEYSFGEDADQGVVNCGFYRGNGDANGPVVLIGWQPQYIMVKNAANAGTNWCVFDTMRGINDQSQGDYMMVANDVDSEYNNDYMYLRPDGFKIRSSAHDVNQNGGIYIFLAIRASDGKVGKPPALGTDAFSIGRGANFAEYSQNCPLGTFQSHDFYSSSLGKLPNGKNNIVDIAFLKETNNPTSWIIGNRLCGTNTTATNNTNQDQGESGFLLDTEYGLGTGWDQDWISYMWTRGPGADVITYKGNYVGYPIRALKHGLGRKPELIFAKCVSTNSTAWVGYTAVKGAGYYYDGLSNDAGHNGGTRWASVEPDENYFYVGSAGDINQNGEDYVAYLFSSVDEISKVDSYVGNGSSDGPTVTCGFKPRFVLIKTTSDNSSTNTSPWTILDSQRGIITNGNDYKLWLNSVDTSTTAGGGVMNLTDTGFVLKTNSTSYNQSGVTYMYYAHS